MEITAAKIGRSIKKWERKLRFRVAVETNLEEGGLVACGDSEWQYIGRSVGVPP
jgi:hypothetical protein